MNPFIYGRIVLGKEFAGRKNLVKELSQFFLNSQHTLIFGHRRIGKSSLIVETARKHHREIDFINIDLMGIKTAENFCRKVLNAIAVSKPFSKHILDIIRLFPRLRPTISTDWRGGVSVSLQLEEKESVLGLEEVFQAINKIKRNKPLVIALDEFQDTASLPDAETFYKSLRGIIQHQKGISYIFCGSKRSFFKNIFLESNSPLFKSVAIIPVLPVTFNEFSPFIKKQFAAGKRSISDDLLLYIFEKCRYITGDIQQFCEVIWSNTNSGDIIDEKIVRSSLEKIFLRNIQFYETWIRLLTAFQVNILKNIAVQGGKSVYSNNFMATANITSSSALTKTLERLINLDIIYKEDNEYFFVHPFFKEWIIRTNL
jgi:hypothetical protein